MANHPRKKAIVPRRVNFPLPKGWSPGRVLFGLAVLAPRLGWTGILLVTNLGDSGSGSLRQAIADAHDGDVISFTVNGTNVLTSASLTITQNITIAGPGARNLTISGNDQRRVFNIPGGRITISGLTITHGRVAGTAGAGIFNSAGAGILNLGDLTVVDCEIRENTILGVPGVPGVPGGEGPGGSGSPGGNAYGGGIYSGGSLTLSNCTVAGNVAQGGTGGQGGNGVNSGGNGGRGGNAHGGGIFYQPTTLDLRPNHVFLNCTFFGNLAQAGNGGNGGNGATGGDGGDSGDALGGGLYQDENILQPDCGTETVNCTISGNVAAGGTVGGPGEGTMPGRSGHSGQVVGGGIFGCIATPPGEAMLAVMINTIVAQNQTTDPQGPTLPSDVFGMVNSFGGNLIGVTNQSSGWYPIGGVDFLGRIGAPMVPQVGLLSDNGGQTRTVPLLFGSPAIDSGNDFVLYEWSLVTDQRGYPRRHNTHVDIGAYEYGARSFSLPWLDTPALRQTLTQAQDGDRLVISLPPFPHAKWLIDGELIVDKSVDIIGPSAGMGILSGGGSNRVFHITTNATVNISGLTIADGASTPGGGILNEGTLQVSECLIASNQAPSFGAMGGGIYSSGTLTVSGSTFLGNNAAFGGGLANAGILNTFNCTFTANYGSSKGGGLFHFGSSALLRNCTVAANTASDGGSGLAADLGTAVPDLLNCLVAGNIGFVPDAYGIFHSLGYNLIGVADPNFTQGFGAIADQVGTALDPIDARLGPLQDNGGPTPTMAPLPGSPAIDQGRSDGIPTDQRGGLRPVSQPGVTNNANGDSSDIGAYERDGLFFISQTRLDIGSVPPTFSFCFRSELGNSYRVEYVQALSASNSWRALTNQVLGAGTLEWFSDSTTQDSARFYRAILLP